jgi:DNA-directed RNA polymerase specialized sigma24 family protein
VGVEEGQMIEDLDPPPAAPIDPTMSASRAYATFVERDGPRLRRALCARFGVDDGMDVTADALAYAWEHWSEVAPMSNPLGYLYRVGQSSARRHRRWRRPIGLLVMPHDDLAGIEPNLGRALMSLDDDRRVAIVLVHGFGWTYAEAGAALDVPVSTVRNHLHRGLAQLRTILGDQR